MSRPAATVRIRTARTTDVPRLLELLEQIRAFHQAARPDIFRAQGRKYETADLAESLGQADSPIFVAVGQAATAAEVDEANQADRVEGAAKTGAAEAVAGADRLLGYVMCQLKVSQGSSVIRPAKWLYVDDLCVDQAARGSGVGAALLERAKAFAREQGCDRVELNVWEFPGSATDFYAHQGFVTQRREMEYRL